MNYSKINEVKRIALKKTVASIVAAISKLMKIFGDNIDIVFMYTLYSKKGVVLMDDHFVSLNPDMNNIAYYDFLMRDVQITNEERARFKHLINLKNFTVICISDRADDEVIGSFYNAGGEWLQEGRKYTVTNTLNTKNGYCFELQCKGRNLLCPKGVDGFDSRRFKSIDYTLLN